MFYIARSLTDKNEFLTSVMWSLGFSFFFFWSLVSQLLFPPPTVFSCVRIGRLPSCWQWTFFIIFFSFLSAPPPPLLLQIIFPFIPSFFFLPSPSPLSLRSAAGLYLTGNIPADVAAVVDLTPWQTPSIGMICIHKSIGYLTLANIPGQRGAAVLSRPGHIIIGDGGLMKCDSAAAATATAADWLTHSPPCPL